MLTINIKPNDLTKDQVDELSDIVGNQLMVIEWRNKKLNLGCDEIINNTRIVFRVVYEAYSVDMTLLTHLIKSLPKYLDDKTYNDAITKLNNRLDSFIESILSE